MFNFLKKKNREYNVPEQALPYKLEELRDLFTRVFKDKHFTTVGSETIRSVIIHIDKMYTNVPVITIGNTPEALAITLNDLRGTLYNRYRGVNTIDEAIRTLISSYDNLNDKVPYPIFETMIDNLIRYSNTNSGVRGDLKALKVEVKYSRYVQSLYYRFDSIGYYGNTTGYTVDDLVNKLRKIQEENNNMHVTFDDVINLPAKGLTLTEKQDGTIYILYALANLYHLKETYKNNANVSQYLDYVDSKLTRLSMKNEMRIPLNKFLSYIYTAKGIYDYLDVDNTYTTVTGEFYVHDHIPTVSEKLKETRDNDIKWTISAKEELIKWYNTLPNDSVYGEAVLSQHYYPKAYHLLSTYPEYLTNKGYTLKPATKRHYTNKGVELTPVNIITVSWGTTEMKRLLAFVLDGVYDYETNQSI